MSRDRTARGRTSAEILQQLRQELTSGKYHAGQFIPTQRQLAETFNVAPDTVRRALKALEVDGLLQARARQGFCVQGNLSDPHAGCPLAFLDDWQEVPARSWSSIERDLLAALRVAAGRRGWSVLSMSVWNLPLVQAVARLQTARAFGAVLSSEHPETVEALRGLPFPLLLLEQGALVPGYDAVMQDDYQGGLLAAQHLLACGCRRIAWLGPVNQEPHTLARLGGAAAALLAAGAPLTPERMFRADLDADTAPATRALFARRERPDGILALWAGHTLAARQAALAQKLVVGRNIHIVGWSADETYETSYLPMFAGGPIPPSIGWSIRAMAEAAVSRIVERRSNPNAPALQIRVPVRLRGAAPA
jgi:LacI family transcriptional regulator